jgi:hypothetical protein
MLQYRLFEDNDEHTISWKMIHFLLCWLFNDAMPTSMVNYRKLKYICLFVCIYIVRCLSDYHRDLDWSLDLLNTYTYNLSVAVAERSEAWTVFDRSEAVIARSNPALGKDV